MTKSLIAGQPEDFNNDWVFGQIASGIDLASTKPEDLTRGQQWKVWLSLNEKSSLDLIAELRHAPGKPKPGEALSDIPVPYYEPGPQQWGAHEADERVLLVAGGWRAGKSKWLAAQLLPYMFKDYGYVWIVANDYHLAREEFNYIHMWLTWLNVPLAKPASKPKEGMWRLETAWGAVVETMTGKDEDKIEMANLNACGIAEAGQTESTLLGKVRGRVFQKRGKIFISGSLVGAQPWYVNALKKYKNGDAEGGWRSFSIPSFDNKAVFPLGEADPEIAHMKREQTPEEFARKVLALPVPPEGLVFSEFSEDTHIVPIKEFEVTQDRVTAALQQAYSPFGSTSSSLGPQPIKDGGGFTIKGWEIPEGYPVEIAVDPGWDPGAYAVLAIVRAGDNVLVIDEVYERLKTGEQVIQECKQRPWWPYVSGGTIDIAAKQHQMNESQLEVWQKETGMRLRTQFVPISDGISRYRNFLSNPENGLPRLFVDPKCDMLVWEHSQYKYPPHRDDKRIQETPIDRDNHAIKALTYFLVIRYGFTNRTQGTTSKRYIDRKTAAQRGSHGLFQSELDQW